MAEFCVFRGLHWLAVTLIVLEYLFVVVESSITSTESQTLAGASMCACNCGSGDNDAEAKGV